ncbi:MAG: polysaccharide biosynthesis C-terminal domain-containing protein [Candidatus Omnitrophota bacterium]
MNNNVELRERKNIGRNSLYIYLGKVFATIFSSLTFIYISRKLPLADYGLYSLFSAILIFLSFLLPLGFPTTMLRFIPKLVEEKNISVALYLIKKSIWIVLSSGSLFLILSFILRESLGKIFNNYELKFYLPLLMVIGGESALAAVFKGISNALFLQKKITVNETVTVVAQLLLVLLFFNLGYYLYGILIAMVIANVLLLIFYFNHLSKFMFNKFLPIADRIISKRFFRFSLKECLFMTTGYFWDITVDIFLITYILGSDYAALFGFAAFISLFLKNWMPGLALQNLIRPLFAKSYSRNKSKEDLIYLFRFYSKLNAFCIFPVIIGMWILIGKIIVFVFGDKFLPAVDTFRILLFFAMLQSFIRPINNLFAILERNEIPIYANMLIFYRLFISLFLIKFFGIQGAAWAFGSAVLLSFLLQYSWLKKIINVNFPYIVFCKIALNSFIMGAVVYFLRDKITNLACLILGIITGVIIYLGISYLNKIFKSNERLLINEIIGVKIFCF